jgi:D-alanyl-lipoteichoic acid acyltransferase DltB (MBOAT superfamily)
MSPETLLDGGQRILLGVFKKFVLADSLAIIALNSQNSMQTAPGVWAWVLLYAYTLRIFFDFAGYTDIALGMGRWLGIHLPENFASPYFKTNLTAFWNSWHITLAQWFRAYFFNPATRALRSSPTKLPVWLVILVGQAGTMLLIGLWHGVTWNFVAWGLWHAIGLFAHNRWSDWARPIMNNLDQRPSLRRLAGLGAGF